MNAWIKANWHVLFLAFGLGGAAVRGEMIAAEVRMMSVTLVSIQSSLAGFDAERSMVERDRRDVDSLRAGVKADMQAMENKLFARIDRVEDSLRREIQARRFKLPFTGDATPRDGGSRAGRSDG